MQLASVGGGGVSCLACLKVSQKIMLPNPNQCSTFSSEMEPCSPQQGSLVPPHQGALGRPASTGRILEMLQNLLEQGTLSRP